MNSLFLGLVTVLAADWPPAASAPPPPPPPVYAPVYNYNYDRAYRHFLSSPSGLKTFSSLGQGYRVDAFAPFRHEGFYREPGYEHQRIGPSGWERYYWVPGYGGSVQAPFFEGGYRVPGYGVYSWSPPPYPRYAPSYFAPPPHGR